MRETVKSDDEGIDDYFAKKVSSTEYNSFKANKTKIADNKPMVDGSCSLRKYHGRHPNLMVRQFAEEPVVESNCNTLQRTQEKRRAD